MATLKACVQKMRNDGFFPVYIRVTHSRTTQYIKTDKMVTKRELLETPREFAPPRASDDDPCGQTRVAFPEEFGKESKATYYHQFKENMPFFIDYAFTNSQTFAFEIGKWDKSESDHCPLMIVL